MPDPSQTPAIPSDRDHALSCQAHAHGMDLAAELLVGGRYAPTARHGDQVFVSGQVPRIGSEVVVTGEAGGTVSLEEAQRAARICAIRALAFIQRELGTLDAIASVLRMTVYIRSAPSFTLHSEVADAASDLLLAVLGDAGRHTRTSVGVHQLPKGATVELDLVAGVAAAH